LRCCGSSPTPHGGAVGSSPRFRSLLAGLRVVGLVGLLREESFRMVLPASMPPEGKARKTHGEGTTGATAGRLESRPDLCLGGPVSLLSSCEMPLLSCGGTLALGDGPLPRPPPRHRPGLGGPPWALQRRGSYPPANAPCRTQLSRAPPRQRAPPPPPPHHAGRCRRQPPRRWHGG